MKRKRTNITMKQKQTHITDLNIDVLKHIMIFVAKSSDGMSSFARSQSICKAFMELAEDTEVLKAVVFEKGSVSGYGGSFWQMNGLLSKCARAGNMSATNILLTERLRSSRAKLTAIESAKKHFHEREGAVKAVFTRARMRAATLACKEVVGMIHDIQMDADEIGEQLEIFNYAAIAE